MTLAAPVQALLDSYRAMAAAGGMGDVEQLRSSYRSPDLPDGPIDSVTITDIEVDGVPVRLYRPSVDGALPLHLYTHGGGWVIGSALSGEYDGLLSRRAIDARCLVASVEYPLSPEARFPTALDDCYKALAGLVERAAELSIDPRAVSVGGASAGGVLAEGLALKARDLEGPSLCLQLLEVSSTDRTCSSHTWRYPQPDDDTTREQDIQINYVYFASLDDACHPYASPAFATNLRDLAPAYFLNGEFDPRRDECEAYATRIRDVGGEAICETMTGHIHGSFGIPDWEPARQWRARANEVLAAVNEAAIAGRDRLLPDAPAI